MTLIEAIYNRHSVRSYIQQPLAEELRESLTKYINEKNSESGLNMQLVVDEPKAFKGFNSYGSFHGVENYIVIVGKKNAGLEYAVGYYGEQVVLYAQTLGLNTCWVGLTYSKMAGTYNIGKDEKVFCVIAIGYGKTQGVSHKIRRYDQVCNASEPSPEWFKNGVNAALLAPTAMNQQKFYFEYVGVKYGSDKPLVYAMKKFSLFGYAKIDLGIACAHFEIGAGKENFEWER